jgi:outer membrane autotransporter protein
MRLRRKRLLLASASWIVLTGCPSDRTWGAEFTVGTEAQLLAAITSANASADPASTITLTGNLTVAATIFPAPQGDLRINTQGFTLAGSGLGVGAVVTGTPATPNGRLTTSGTIAGGTIGIGVGIGGVGLTYNSGILAGGNARLVNEGAIAGGAGGSLLGNGGIGLVTTGVVTVTNAGSITGGTATGLLTGNGGAGASISIGTTLTNAGTILGGSGQTGGGAGVVMSGALGTATLINTGTIRGGADLGGGANAGVAVNVVPVLGFNAEIVNSGRIEAGAGQSTAIDFGLLGSATLELRAGSTIIGNVIAGPGGNDTLRLAGSGTATLDGGIGAGGQYSGFDTVQKTGDGTWILTGASTGTGAIQLQAGTLQIGAGGTTGSILGDVANSGTLAFNRSDGVTFTGAISGSGALRQDGTGTLTLTGANTHTGGTTIAVGGTLQIGAGGTAGSLLGNVVNNGTLAFNRSDAVTFAGAVSGAGALRQDGTGTLILTGANTQAGGTTIAVGGTLQIGAGGTAGSILGNVVNNGSLAFNRSDGVAFAGVISGSGAVQQAGTGTTILTGANTYAGGTTIAAGTLQIGAGGATGSIQGNVANSGTLAFNRSDGVTFAGVISGSGAVQQAGTGTTILTGANTYAGGTTIAAGTLQIGAGGTTGSIQGNVDNNGTLAFNRSDGVTFAGAISGSGALRQDGTGTLVLTADNTLTGTTAITAGTLQIGAGGATGSIQGNVVNNAALVVDRSGSVTLPGAISGGGTLRQAGTGTLILGGDNTFTGTTTIAAGTLQIGAGGATGSIQGNIVNNAALVVDRSGSVTLPGIISGSGTLRQAGTGTTILTGANTYAGGTTIAAGTLQIGAGGTTGSIQGNVANSGTLAFNRSDAVTFAGVISGSGAVQQAGTGTTILTGPNTYAGGTTIAAGTLQIGAGGTAGSIQGNIANNGTLAFNRSDGVTFPGTISGTGALSVAGGGTLVLTADNTLTGTTTITASTLQIGAGGTTGGIQGNIVNNGILVVDRSGSVTLPGAISGSGALVVTGGGTVTLTAANTYTGGTTINAGILQIGPGGSILGGITNNGTIIIDRSGSVTLPDPIAGTGALLQTGSGVTVLGGANTYSGPTAVDAGTLRGGIVGAFSPNSAVTVAAAGTLDLAGRDQTVAGLTNAGLVSLGGSPGTRLTVAGNYVGQGGVVALNTRLEGDSAATDRLVISGGSATGDTRIRILNPGGGGGQTVAGIRVVEVASGGATTAGAFRLDARVAAGAYEYLLFRGGNTGADEWYLRSFLPAQPGAPDSPAGPGARGVPLYRPEVALYAGIPAIGRQLGLSTLGTLHERRGEEFAVAAGRDLGKEGDASGMAAWARVFGERRRDRWDGPAEARATADLIGLQAGLDLLQTPRYAGGHRDVAGVYVAYADYNAPGVSGLAIGQQQRVGRLLMSGPAVGAYWTHFGPSGWYVDAVLQANWLEVSARSDFGTGLTTNGHGYAASLEAGFPIRFATGWQIEPQAQVIWQRVSVDRSQDLFSAVAWDDDTAITGRLGARLQYAGRSDRTLWQPYAKVNLRHAFSGSDRVRFGNGSPIGNDFGHTALEVGAGITARINQSTTLYAHADYRWSIAGDSRQTAVQGSFGIRYAW